MKTYRLQFVIFLSFLSLFLLIATGLVFYGYKSNTEVMLQTSDELLYQISETIIKKTTNHLSPAPQIANILSKTIENKRADFNTAQKILSDFSIETLVTFPQISGIYYGSINGSFIMFRRLRNGNYGIKTIIQEHEEKKCYDSEVTADQIVLSTKEINDPFDPRKRDWFIDAAETNKNVWSREYLLYTEQRKGVTCSKSALDQNGNLLGVVGIDFILDDISDFLKTIKIGETGTAFITDTDWNILACPGDIPLKLKENEQTDHKSKHSSLRAPVNIAIKKYMNENLTRFSFDYNGSNHIASFRSFTENLGKDWVLGIIVPEEDFTGAISKIHETTLLFSFWLLILAGFTTAQIAKELTGPLDKITGEVMRIKDLNFHDKFVMKSSVTEIQTMSDAVASMKRVLGSFVKYVPVEIVHKLLKGGEAAKQSVQARKATIMFTDIADFSSITERSDPQELLKQLSEYFDIISGIIVKHHGVIDKYIGDSVMAFWGVPTEDENQAVNACAAAVEIQKKISELNEVWVSQKKAEFKTRIGINTGISLVGNFGSSKRLNYTAIGDSVNLASRLEGLNKLYLSKIIISEDTKKEIGNNFIVRLLDLVTVKGRAKSLNIYQLINIEGENPQEDILGRRVNEIMHEAVKYYINRDWDLALASFSSINELVPKDFISKLYSDRIKKLKADPPNKNWNGVFNVESK